MYLIIADGFKFDDNNRNHFLCTKEYYSNVIKMFPNIKNLDSSEIESLLIYSIRNDHSKENVLEVECKSFIVDDSSIKIEYGKSIKIDATCKTLGNNLYGLLKRKGLLQNGEQKPFVAIVDINEAYKLQGIENPKIKGKIDEINDLKKRHKWIEIINYFGDINKIESLECWNNIQYLNEVIFALGKIVEPGYKMGNNEKLKYEKIFFKAVNQSLSKEPNNQVINSILAYHYYCVFMKEKKNNNGYYDKANKLYLDLVEHSSDNFKEKYRYWKLQQINFDIIKWNLGDNWLNKVNEILTGFQNLILDYQNLSEEKQKRRKKEYIGSLYGYSVFAIENFLQVWDVYADNLIFNKPISKHLFSEDKLQMIIDVDNYLNEIIQLQKLEERETNIDLRVKPSYLDILYRQAQIEQIKGIMHTIKQSTKAECSKYFIKSNNLIEKLFKIAYEHKNKTNFLFPHFAREPRAINDYFLDSPDLHKNFNNAKPYLSYQQAVMYFLQSDSEMALQVLDKIPKNDMCYNKAEILRKRILDENR